MLALSARLLQSTQTHIAGGFKGWHCAFRAAAVLHDHMGRVGAVTHGSSRSFLVTYLPTSHTWAARQQPTVFATHGRLHSGREDDAGTCTWTLFLLPCSDFWLRGGLCLSAFATFITNLLTTLTQMNSTGSKTCSAALQMPGRGFEAPLPNFS